MIVCPLHAYFRPEHVEEVAAEMLKLGPPVLRGFFDEESGAYLMREGTHRLRAAQQLGITPVIKLIPWWRSQASLARARHCTARYGLHFDLVDVVTDESAPAGYTFQWLKYKGDDPHVAVIADDTLGRAHVFGHQDAPDGGWLARPEHRAAFDWAKRMLATRESAMKACEARR